MEPTDPNYYRTRVEDLTYLPKHLEQLALDARYPNAISNTAAIAAAVAPKLDATQKGAANGVAPLDSGSRVPQMNLPTTLDPATLNATFDRAFEASTSIVYDGSGNVTSSTEGGVTTTFTYNVDGTVNTETRLGKVRTWTYDGSGNPTSSTVV